MSSVGETNCTPPAVLSHFSCLLLAQIDFFELLHEIDKPDRLLAQTLDQLRVVQPSVRPQQIVDVRQKDPSRINERIPIPKNRLQLLDGPQGAPHSRTKPNKTHRTILETLRELQHVDEIL